MDAKSPPPPLLDTVAEAEPARPCEMQGFLEKQNPRGFMGYKAWKKRWFKLDETTLRYYETHNETVPPLKIVSIENIKNAYVHPEDPRRFEIPTNLFLQNGKARTFVLRGESESIVKAWVDAVLNNRLSFQAQDLQDLQAAQAQSPGQFSFCSRMQTLEKYMHQTGCSVLLTLH